MGGAGPIRRRSRRSSNSTPRVEEPSSQGALKIVAIRAARSALIEQKAWAEVQRLEDEFILENPNSIEAYFMAAWSSGASGDTTRARRAKVLMMEEFQRSQREVRQRFVARHQNLLSSLYPPGGGSPIRSLSTGRGLLSETSFDEVWGWAQLVPLKYEAGQIATVQGFGNFLINNSEAVIEKRLARAMAWEPAITALVLDAALAANHNFGGVGSVIDVGGNIGATCVPVAQKYRGPVLVFEPEERNHRDLMVNLALNASENVFAHRLAVGAASRRVHILPGPPENPGMARVASELEGGEAVSMVSLDEVAGENRVSAIKVDVEGFEGQVLEGALGILRRDSPPVIVEILGSQQSSAAHHLLTDFGYSSAHLGRSDYMYSPPWFA